MSTQITTMLNPINSINPVQPVNSQPSATTHKAVTAGNSKKIAGAAPVLVTTGHDLLPNFSNLSVNSSSSGINSLEAAVQCFATLAKIQQGLRIDYCSTAAAFNSASVQLEVVTTKLQSALQQYEAQQKEKADKKIKHCRLFGSVCKLLFAVVNLGTALIAPEAVPEEEMAEHAAEKAIEEGVATGIKTAEKKAAAAGSDDAEQLIQGAKKTVKKYNKARLAAAGINGTQGAVSLTATLTNTQLKDGPLSKVLHILSNLLNVAADTYAITQLGSEKYIQATIVAIGDLNAMIKTVGNIDAAATDGKGKLSELSRGLGGLVKCCDPNASVYLTSALDVLGEIGQIWGTISASQQLCTKAFANASTSKLSNFMSGALTTIAQLVLYLIPGEISRELTQIGISTTQATAQIAQAKSSNATQNVTSTFNAQSAVVNNDVTTAMHSLQQVNELTQELIQEMLGVFNSNTQQYAIT